MNISVENKSCFCENSLTKVSMEVEMSDTEFSNNSSVVGKKRELEFVSLFVRKEVYINTRTGEITWTPKSTAAFYLNGSTSRDARGYNIKKSLSDGVLETGNYTHATKASNNKIFAIKDFQDGKSAEASNLAGKLENAETKAARLKQIEDFFTDPVDREIFPKQEPELPSRRKFPPNKTPSVKESVDQMLAQFTCAMKNPDLVQEVYKHRIVPRLQSYNEMMHPPTELPSPPTEQVSLPTGQVSLPIQQLSPPTEIYSPSPGLVSNFDHKNANVILGIHNSVIENPNEQPTELSSDEEKSAHRRSWFVRLFCCGGAASESKKHKVGRKLENGKKGSSIRTRLRKMFGRI